VYITEQNRDWKQRYEEREREREREEKRNERKREGQPSLIRKRRCCIKNRV
jgi:hypothetical protein